MNGKVFKIGYTKRKHIPVLYQTTDKNKWTDGNEWVDVFILVSHLFDAMMRNFDREMRLSMLLIYARCDLKNQDGSNELISRHYYPKKQISSTGSYFIPIKKMFASDLNKWTEEWPYQRLSERPVANQ